MRVGVTGHQRLRDRGGWDWVRTAVVATLQPILDLEGISSLAVGADQVFARCVLGLGGRLVAVVPFPEYATSFSDPADQLEYVRLLNRAVRTVTLPGAADRESAFFEAGKYVCGMSDLLLAVWDGKPAKGRGGTGDVVVYALAAGKAVIQLDPFARTIKELGPP
jgi:hypothetical protein